MARVNCHQNDNCTFGDEVWFSAAERKRTPQMVLGNLPDAIRIHQSVVSETSLEVKRGGIQGALSKFRAVCHRCPRTNKRNLSFFFRSLDCAWASFFSLILERLLKSVHELRTFLFITRMPGRNMKILIYILLCPSPYQPVLFSGKPCNAMIFWAHPSESYLNLPSGFALLEDRCLP